MCMSVSVYTHPCEGTCVQSTWPGQGSVGVCALCKCEGRACEGMGPQVYMCHLHAHVCRRVPTGRRVGGGVGRGQAPPGRVVPVPVNERIEGQAIPPAGGEILDVYLRVTGSMEGRDRGRDGDSQEEKEEGRKRERDRQRWMDGWVDR